MKTETNSILLEANKINKSFGDFFANENVSFSINRGEIHALLGENGAGKSTFVKIIYGIQKPDSGLIYWKGKQTDIKGPKHARSLGIGMVFQHFSLFESLTVTENIALAINNYENLKSLENKIVQISNEYGIEVNPSSRIYNLSVGEQQRVEIIRCLLQNPDLLIMDEPTSVLTPQEINQLFSTLKQLSSNGCSILFISHKLEEIRTLTTRATVLRRGKNVDTVDTQKHNANSLARMMVGYDVEEVIKKNKYQNKELQLQIKNLSIPRENRFSTELKNIKLDVYSGEILGIAGISGNGQSELMEILTGEKIINEKNILIFNNQDITNLTPDQRRKIGISFIPEERIGHSAVTELSLSENVLLTDDKISNKFLDVINYKNLSKIASKIINDNDVRTTGNNAKAGSLSGGNLQKFIVGRELLKKPSLLIASQPTWGVDVGAASYIRKNIINLSSEGSAVVLISQDLDEILSISDKICVIFEGMISPVFSRNDINIDKIGLLMGGSNFEVVKK